MKKTFLVLVFIFILAYLVVFLFHPNSPKLGADDRYPLSPVFRLQTYHHIWSHYVKMLGGAVPLRMPTLFPAVLFLSVLEKLQLPVFTRQLIEYYLLYLVAGLGTFYLVFLLTDKKSASLVASSIYLFNPYFLFSLIVSRDQTYLWAFYPMLVAFFIRGLLSEKKISGAILLNIVFLFSAPGANNFPLLAIVFMTFVFWIAYFWKFSPEKISLSAALKYCLFCGIIYFLFNSWWIIPFLTQFSSVRQEFAQAYDPLIYLRQLSSQSSFLAVMRLNFETNPTEFVNASNIEIFTSFILPILVMGAVIFRPIKRKLIIFLGMFTFFFIFLAKGAHPPLANVYEWIYLNLPGFLIFRSPVNKFGMAVSLGYAFLAGIAIAQIAFYFVNKLRVAGFLLLLIICPFLFAYLIPYFKKEVKFIQYPNVIPDYYYSAKDWLSSENDDFRLLSLPANAVIVDYLWSDGSRFRGYDFVMDLWQRPIVDFLAGDAKDEPIRFQALKPLGQKQLRNIYPQIITDYKSMPIMRLMNIKYVLLHRDANWQVFDITSPEETKTILESQQKLSLYKSFGELDFYKINDFLPHLYATDKAFLVSGNLNSVFAVLAETNFLEKKPALLITDQMSDKEISQAMGNTNLAIFINSQLEDLSIDILKTKYRETANKRKEFKIRKSGLFELWIESGNLSSFGKVDLNFVSLAKILFFKIGDLITQQISLDRNSYPLNSQRWNKVAEMQLDSGDYLLTTYDETIDKMIGEVVLVPSDERKKTSSTVLKQFENNKIWPIFVFSRMKADAGEKFFSEKTIERKVTLPMKMVFNQFIIDQGKLILQNSLALKKGENRVSYRPKSIAGGAQLILEPKEISLLLKAEKNINLSFRSINPSLYEFEMENKKPAWIVFSESYHPEWKIRPEKSNSDENHFIVNGYANAWYLTGNNRSGYKLEFGLQKYFWIGLAISTTAILFIVLFKIFAKLLKRKK